MTSTQAPGRVRLAVISSFFSPKLLDSARHVLVAGQWVKRDGSLTQVDGTARDLQTTDVPA